MEPFFLAVEWDLNGIATDSNPRHPCLKVAVGKFEVVSGKNIFVLREQGKSHLAHQLELVLQLS